MMGGGMNGFGSFGAFGWIGMILNFVITLGVIVGVIWLVVWTVKRLSTNQQGPGSTFGGARSSETPREIVQSRYARGEITREQYQDILADLS